MGLIVCLQLNLEFELITGNTLSDDVKSMWLSLVEKIFVQAKNEEVNRTQLQQILTSQCQELKTLCRQSRLVAEQLVH